MVFSICLSIILFLFRETRKERRPKVGVSAGEAGTLEADTLYTSALLGTILGIFHLSLDYPFLVSRDEKKSRYVSYFFTGNHPWYFPFVSRLSFLLIERREKSRYVSYFCFTGNHPWYFPFVSRLSFLLIERREKNVLWSALVPAKLALLKQIH